MGRGGGHEMVLELEAISKEETALCAFCDLLWWRPCLYCRAAFVWFLLLLYLRLFATVIHLVLNLVFYLGLYDQHDLHEFDSGLLFRGTFPASSPSKISSLKPTFVCPKKLLVPDGASTKYLEANIAVYMMKILTLVKILITLKFLKNH